MKSPVILKPALATCGCAIAILLLTTQAALAEQPRSTSRIAVAGSLDITNDGMSDLALIREIIRTNDGTIDARLDSQGNLVGRLGEKTGLLIVGKPPAELGAPADVQARYVAFLRRASSRMGPRPVRISSSIRR